MFNPGAAVSIDDTVVEFDFLSGADPNAFLADGLLNLNTFFASSDGGAFGSEFGLDEVFQDDTFQTDLAGYRIDGFDPATGALDWVAVPAPDACSTLLLAALGVALLAGLARPQTNRA